ncbi:unnamed protein product [Cylicocyclus nassatus]|uniref:Uncharacterized protein n=1 Tax=Cylicocyclus nassatus TaxID=53992 RepID=A0AA36GGH3_CYLNA|nr:unnamed protein product [Cylicocyclus nassatus]
MLENGSRQIMLMAEEKSETSSEPDIETIPWREKRSPSVQRLIVRDTENALHALRVMHHKLNKKPIKHQMEERRRIAT